MKNKIVFELDEYEQFIERNLDKTEKYPDDVIEKKRQEAKDAAKTYLHEKAHVLVDISVSDLENIKTIATKKGLPWQSLITDILHQYSIGHRATA